MNCNKCGTENETGSRYCKECGNQLIQPAPQPAPEPVPQTRPQTTVQPSTTQGTANNNGNSVTCMVLGIVSCVFACSAIVSLICGIIAIMLYRKDTEAGIVTGFGKAGLVCGIIGVVGGALVTLYYLIVLGVMACIPIFAQG